MSRAGGMGALDAALKRPYMGQTHTHGLFLCPPPCPMAFPFFPFSHLGLQFLFPPAPTPTSISSEPWLQEAQRLWPRYPQGSSPQFWARCLPTRGGKPQPGPPTLTRTPLRRAPRTSQPYQGLAVPGSVHRNGKNSSCPDNLSRRYKQQIGEGERLSGRCADGELSHRD